MGSGEQQVDEPVADGPRLADVQQLASLLRGGGIARGAARGEDEVSPEGLRASRTGVGQRRCRGLPTIRRTSRRRIGEGFGRGPRCRPLRPTGPHFGGPLVEAAAVPAGDQRARHPTMLRPRHAPGGCNFRPPAAAKLSASECRRRQVPPLGRPAAPRAHPPKRAGHRGTHRVRASGRTRAGPSSGRQSTSSGTPAAAHRVALTERSKSTDESDTSMSRKCPAAAGALWAWWTASGRGSPASFGGEAGSLRH